MNKKLEADMTRIDKESSKLKSEINAYDLRTNNEILSLNNTIAMLRERKETLEQKRNQLESELEGSTKSTFEEKILIGRIFMAIHNLNQRSHSFNNFIKKRGKGTGSGKGVNKFGVRGEKGKKKEKKKSSEMQDNEFFSGEY